MRKSYDKAFKSKVALEAIREESTLQELGKKYDVHPNQISQWKRQVIEAMLERPAQSCHPFRSKITREEDEETLYYRKINSIGG